MNWYFWTTLNWVRDVGGARLLVGELLVIAGICVVVFAALVASVRPLPALEFGLGPLGVIVGGAFVVWGVRAHCSAGLAWWDWDWEGEGR